MQCKRAPVPVHLTQSKETSTSTSMQGDQISNTSIYSEQIHISSNHNILEQFIQTSNVDALNVERIRIERMS